MLLMINVHYRLTYRSLEGFARWAFALMLPGLKMPHYTLPCKRAAYVDLPKFSSKKPRIVILDSSGLKVLGEGEWKRKIHGKGKSRKWIKVHLAIDAKTQEIVAEAALSLLGMTPKSVKMVLADGAYDGRSVREEIRQRKAKALIPPPRNARYRGEEDERDDALRLIGGLGNDEGALGKADRM